MVETEAAGPPQAAESGVRKGRQEGEEGQQTSPQTAFPPRISHRCTNAVYITGFRIAGVLGGPSAGHWEPPAGRNWGCGGWRGGETHWLARTGVRMAAQAGGTESASSVVGGRCWWPQQVTGQAHAVTGPCPRSTR